MKVNEGLIVMMNRIKFILDGVGLEKQWGSISKCLLQSFICQINCSDLRLAGLPSKGILYFFYSSKSVFDEGGEALLAETYVFHSEGSGYLDRIPFPEALEAEWRYHSSSVKFIPELTLPPSESSIIRSFGMTYENNSEDLIGYITGLNMVRESLYIKDNRLNRILGYPDQLQGDLQSAATQIWNANHADKTQPMDWRLLLQVDSDRGNGMMWGDAGRLYFMITEKRLQTMDFHNCIGIYQC